MLRIASLDYFFIVWAGTKKWINGQEAIEFISRKDFYFVLDDYKNAGFSAQNGRKFGALIVFLYVYANYLVAAKFIPIYSRLYIKKNASRQYIHKKVYKQLMYLIKIRINRKYYKHTFPNKSKLKAIYTHKNVQQTNGKQCLRFI